MTRHTLGLFALTALGIITTQGAAMAQTPPEPEPKPKDEPTKRPYDDPHRR